MTGANVKRSPEGDAVMNSTTPEQNLGSTHLLIEDRDLFFLEVSEVAKITWRDPLGPSELSLELSRTFRLGARSHVMGRDGGTLDTLVDCYL